VRYIYDLSIDELKAELNKIGEKSYRSAQIFSALHSGTVVNEISNIPNILKEYLTANFNCALPEILEEKQSADGTKKYLLQYGGDCVECVLLTQDYGNTICVSTQVGCRMNCAFCASGKDGFVRNLTAGEILAEVILVNKLNLVPQKNTAKDKRGITNIVLMGSGEPLDNFDEVMKFLSLVTSPDGINISGRNISLSTSGLVPQIKKIADMGTQVNLCVSLHAPNDEIRRQIMPIAKKYPVRDLIDAAKYYFNKTHRRVIFEYSLMCKNGAPFNCSPDNARELSALVRGFPAHINLINLNPLKFDGGGNPHELTPPGRETAMKFMDAVIKSGVSCTMRKNKGDDIDGACGQLRTKFISRLKRATY
jgi:23S rRNA (adenine2503-C2)-methyltransferase